MGRVGGGRVFLTQAASERLIENDISGEVVFAIYIANAPSKTVFMIAHEDTFHATRAAFITKFQWDSSKAMAPPYSEVVNVRLFPIKCFIRRRVCWKGRGG